MSTVPGQKSKQPRRSRIIINIDEPQAAAKKGSAPQRKQAHRARANRRRMVVPLAVIAVVLLALLSGAYFWWQSYKAQPAYSLALVLDAARRNDQTAFDALVDVDSVSRSLVPQVTAQLHAASAPQIPPPVRRQIEANAAVLLPGAREQLRATLLEQIKLALVRSGAADKSFLLLALGVARGAEVKPGLDGADSDMAATATMNVNSRPVELGLRASDEASNRSSHTRWRIVRVKSDELAARVAETLARVYPAGR